MEAIFATLTDQERVQTLNSVYQKGLSTSKENLAFSSDKLVYLKPFISKLQNENNLNENLGSRVMVRQIVDELLLDIAAEITATCGGLGKEVSRVAAEYGLTLLLSPSSTEAQVYYNKVA